MDTNLFFLFYRILPFVLISFFTIYSVIQGTIDGALVSIGALLTCFLVSVISNMSIIMNALDDTIQNILGSDKDVKSYREYTCNILYYNGQLISYLPLSTTTISFIVGYLSNIADKTLLLFIPLVVLLIIDVIYNFNYCSRFFVIIPLALGLGIGYGWGKATNAKRLTDSNEKCTNYKAQQKFNCRRRGVN
jgi:hypothetical protein